jgi:hypothetical protein
MRVNACRLGLFAPLLAIVAAACSSTGSAANSEVLDPAQSHYGQTDSELGALWWRWIYELPQTDPKNCNIPFLDPTGGDCAAGQPARGTSGDVFFLAGTGGGTVVRDKCVVPSGKALFFPIFNFTADNAGVPAAMQQTPMALQALVQAQVDMVPVSMLSVEFDGAAISDLARFKTSVTQFNYILPPEPNIYDCQGQTGVIGTIDPSFAAGYYIMLAPPTPGAHTLHFTGSAPTFQPPLSIDVTYHLMIQ